MLFKQFLAKKTFLANSIVATNYWLTSCYTYLWTSDPLLHKLYLSACLPVTMLQTTDHLQTAITLNLVPVLSHMPSRQKYLNCLTPQGLSQQSNEASLPTTILLFSAYFPYFIRKYKLIITCLPLPSSFLKLLVQFHATQDYQYLLPTTD